MFSLVTFADAYIWLGVLVTSLLSVGAWQRGRWITRIGGPSPEDQIWINQFRIKVLHSTFTIPFTSVALALGWAYQHTRGVRDDSIDVLSGLASYPWPVGLCVALGLAGICWSVRSAAINTQGVARIPSRKKIVVILVVLAALGEGLFRRFAYHPAIIVGAILIFAVPFCFLRIGSLADLWYSKTETYFVIALVSGSVLTADSALVGLMWAFFWLGIGSRLGDLIGWCRTIHPTLAFLVEATRWAAILLSVAWVFMNPAIIKGIIETHTVLFLAFLVPVLTYSPLYLLPMYRAKLRIKSPTRDIGIRSASSQEKNRRIGGGSAARMVSSALKRLKLAQRTEDRAPELVRMALLDLAGAQWAATREEWPSLLETESAALTTWLKANDGRGGRESVTDRNLGLNPQAEVRLRLLVYSCRNKSSSRKPTDNNEMNEVYRQLNAGHDYPVVTRWLLWRAIFSRYPDRTEESRQQAKLLVHLETLDTEALLREVPPGLWTPIDSNGLQLLRLAERAAWWSMACAGKIHEPDSAGALLPRCRVRWEGISRLRTIAETDPLMLKHELVGSRQHDPEKIFQAVSRAALWRPARRKAEALAACADRLTSYGAHRVIQRVEMIAGECKQELRERIASGFTLPKSFQRKGQ